MVITVLLSFAQEGFLFKAASLNLSQMFQDFQGLFNGQQISRDGGLIYFLVYWLDEAGCQEEAGRAQ